MISIWKLKVFNESLLRDFIFEVEAPHRCVDFVTPTYNRTPWLDLHLVGTRSCSHVRALHTCGSGRYGTPFEARRFP